MRWLKGGGGAGREGGGGGGQNASLSSTLSPAPLWFSMGHANVVQAGVSPCGHL